MLNQKEDTDKGAMAEHIVTNVTEMKTYEGVTKV